MGHFAAFNLSTLTTPTVFLGEGVGREEEAEKFHDSCAGVSQAAELCVLDTSSLIT